MGQSSTKYQAPTHHGYGDDDNNGLVPGEIYDRYQVYIPSHRSRAGEITTLKTNQSTDPRGDLDHLVGIPDQHQALLNPRLLATAMFRNKTGIEPRIPPKQATGGWMH